MSHHIFNYHDLNNTKKSVALPLSTEDYISLKTEVQGLDLSNYYIEEFWKIRDSLFCSQILDPFKPKVVDFCKQNQNRDFELVKDFLPEEIKVMAIYYHFYYWYNIYLFSDSYFPYDATKRIELHLSYDLDELNHLLEQIMNDLGIKDSAPEEGLAEADLEIGVLFTERIFDWWQEAKQETDSSLKAHLTYATGGSSWDMNSREKIEDDSDDGLKRHFEV